MIAVGLWSPAHALAAPLVSDPDAGELARGIAATPSLVTGGEYVNRPPRAGATGLATEPLAGFPTSGAEFGILTTGNAERAYAANTSGSSGSDLQGAPVRGNTDLDVTVLRVDFEVPARANCLGGLDFRFLSEEYPEWVGSSYNDAFIAELDESTWTTRGSTIEAPRNFAFDPQGKPISVNVSGLDAMRPEYAEGTTYDGATPMLTAATPIAPGRHSLYLSIFDQGDRVYDSAVFVDNLRFTRVVDPQRDCQPGAELVDNTDYVALGDSYSSGYGAGDYEPGTNGDPGPNDCQRSRNSFAWPVGEGLGLATRFHACQGAVTRDLYESRPSDPDWGEPPQFDQLGPETGLVSFSIGGNDAGFAKRLKECIIGFELLPFNTCSGDDKVLAPVAEAFARLDGATAAPANIVPYDAIGKDVRRKTPYATRIAVGYPRLFRLSRASRVSALRTPIKRGSTPRWTRSTRFTSATRSATASVSSILQRPSPVMSCAVRQRTGSSRFSLQLFPLNIPVGHTRLLLAKRRSASRSSTR